MAVGVKGPDRGENLESTEEEPRMEAGKSWLAEDSCKVVS